MYLTLSLDGITLHRKAPKLERNKGNSLVAFPDSYCLIDIETTGLYSDSEILEIGAIRVTDNQIVETFQTFVYPQIDDEDRFDYADDDEDMEDDLIEIMTKDEQLADYIPSEIVELTGITVDMLMDAPPIDVALKNFHDFVKNDILIGHNVNFDINNLYDHMKYINGAILDNDFVDTLRLPRKAFKKFPRHTRAYLIEALNIPSERGHRSVDDCESCMHIFLKCKEVAMNVGIDEWVKLHKSKNARPTTQVVDGNPENLDPENPLYEKMVVFTGTLSRMVRKDAMQLVKNIGGNISDTVSTKTDYLVMGIQDYNKFADGKESSKTKKAKALQEKGQILHIISEDDFYRIALDLEK